LIVFAAAASNAPLGFHGVCLHLLAAFEKKDNDGPHHSSSIASESQHRKGMQSPSWDSVWGNVEGRRDPLTFFEIRELVYLCTQCEETPGTSVPAWHQTAFRQIWPYQNHQNPSGRPRHQVSFASFAPDVAIKASNSPFGGDM
jgi:hypothetical protein